MNDKFLDHMENVLESHMKETEKTIDSLSYSIKNEKHPAITTNHSQVSNHPADIGSELFEKEKEIALINDQRELSDKIQGALERIDSGSYGNCEYCSKSIESERLEILPYTNRCASCAKENDENFVRKKDYISEETIENFYNVYEELVDSGAYESDENLIALQEPDYIVPGCVEQVESISNEQYRNQLL